MAETRNFKIELAKHLTLTTIDNKLVLFSKQSGDFFGLNESALFLLKTLLENNYQITVQLAVKEFGVDAQVIQSDLLELVRDLESQKLLRKIDV